MLVEMDQVEGHPERYDSESQKPPGGLTDPSGGLCGLSTENQS